MANNTIAYLEVPAKNVPGLKKFYASLFGWEFRDWGEDYASFSGAGVNGGFNGSNDHRTNAPLIVIETDNIERMEKAVVEAGGRITTPTFSFPGGRRFHFTDPDGNELSVMQHG